MLPGAANIFWKGGGEIYDSVAQSLRVSDVEFSLPISKRMLELSKDNDFHCLIVRYGADGVFVNRSYLTESDKREGSRQLRTIPVAIQTLPTGSALVVKIPIHKYLGTQFKFFATPKKPGGIDQLEKELGALVPAGRMEKPDNCPSLQSYVLTKNPNAKADILCVDRGATNGTRFTFS